MLSLASYTITNMKDGNDLEAIAVLYIVTSSDTTPPSVNDEGWQESMPEFEAGKYVWTMNKITIIDPTTTTPIVTYTDPVLDTSWRKMDDLNTKYSEIKQTVDNITLSITDGSTTTSVKISNGTFSITSDFASGLVAKSDYMSYDSTNGLQIGHKGKNGAWTGYRTRINSGSFDILTGERTEVASFGSSSVELCGGEFKIMHTPNGLAYTSITSGNLHLGADSIWLDCPEYSTTNYVRMEEGRLAIGVNSDNPDYNTEIMITDEVAVEGKVSATSDSVTWIKGRDGAAFKSTVQPGSTGSYLPLTSVKSYNGSWETGTLGDALYFVYGTDANYNAGINTTMNGVCIYPDGTLYCNNANVKGVSLFASAGATLTCNMCACSGFITNDANTIYFQVTLPKILDTVHNKLTVTTFKANIRKSTGGYIGAATSVVSGGYDYLSNSNYTVGISSYNPLSIEMFLRNDATKFDAANNSPVALECYIQFKVN